METSGNSDVVKMDSKFLENIAARDEANEKLIDGSFGASFREKTIELYFEDLSITFNKEDYTAEEWKTLQGHVWRKFDCQNVK